MINMNWRSLRTTLRTTMWLIFTGMLASCGQNSRLQSELANLKIELLETNNKNSPLADVANNSQRDYKATLNRVVALEREVEKTQTQRENLDKKKRYLEDVLKSVEDQAQVLADDLASYSAKYLK